MIALLSGQLAFKAIDHVIIDVGGVGYRLLIPLSSFYALPEAGMVQLHVHTHVREDAIHLFGFLSMTEKRLFLLLQSVSGIGPKLALNILSHASADELRRALGQGDAKRLAALPGLGKKTAERLILELKDKVGTLGGTSTSPSLNSPAPAPAATDRREDTLSALINLGYKEAQARNVLESMDIEADASLESILKGALKNLVR